MLCARPVSHTPLYISSFGTDVRVAAADIEYRFRYEVENVSVKILNSEGKHLENDIRIVEIKKFPLKQKNSIKMQLL